MSRDFWIVYFASALPAARWRSFRESNRFRSDYRNDYDFVVQLTSYKLFLTADDIAQTFRSAAELSFQPVLRFGLIWHRTSLSFSQSPHKCSEHL